MKKILLFSIISYLSVLGLYAQSLEISDGNGQYNNGDTIVYFSTDVNKIFVVHMDVKNVSNKTIDVKTKKTELKIEAGSENYFCWGSCYDPSIFISQDSVRMNSGDVFTQFSGDYEATKVTGASYIMYTFFDQDNINDSIAFVVKYLTGTTVGVEESTPEVSISSLYPNPAKNNVSINYDLNGANNARIEIRNILGSVVKIENITESNGQVNMEISDLTNGVYFYSFIVNEQVIKSSKLVIQH